MGVITVPMLDGMARLQAWVTSKPGSVAVAAGTWPAASLLGPLEPTKGLLTLPNGSVVHVLRGPLDRWPLRFDVAWLDGIAMPKDFTKHARQGAVVYLSRPPNAVGGDDGGGMVA